MTNYHPVKQIIEYIEAKIESLKERLKKYEAPIMQEMTKTSPHLQMEYIRIVAEIQANEDNLLAIRKFNLPVITQGPENPANKAKKTRQKLKENEKEEPQQ